MTGTRKGARHDHGDLHRHADVVCFTTEINGPKATKIASSQARFRRVHMESSFNPFWQGVYVFNDGSGLKACPFPRGSSEAYFWNEGFALAYALVNSRERTRRTG